MPMQATCSKTSDSLLVRFLLQRSGEKASSQPERVMNALVESIRRKRICNIDQQLQLFLRDRNVTQIEFTPNLKCDGLIEPLGIEYRHGFRIRLKKDAAPARTRFTLAHEACHTFFYELVPEIKFSPHEQDDQEEQLCNFGAAVLLMPPTSLLRSVKKLSVNLESLQVLASEYGVSLPTMALRLKALGYWNCQLTFWHHMADGTFAFDRVYGGKQLRYQWEDGSVLMAAWQSDKSRYGRTFVHCVDDNGTTWTKLVRYQARRFANCVMVLWGADITRPSREPLPLFSGRTKSPIREVAGT